MKLHTLTFRDGYLRRHECDLLRHYGAENMLKHMGMSIDTKNLDADKLRSEYNTLYSKKANLAKHL